MVDYVMIWVQRSFVSMVNIDPLSVSVCFYYSFSSLRSFVYLFFSFVLFCSLVSLWLSMAFSIYLFSYLFPSSSLSSFSLIVSLFFLVVHRSVYFFPPLGVLWFLVSAVYFIELNAIGASHIEQSQPHSIAMLNMRSYLKSARQSSTVQGHFVNFSYICGGKVHYIDNKEDRLHAHYDRSTEKASSTLVFVCRDHTLR